MDWAVSEISSTAHDRSKFIPAIKTKCCDMQQQNSGWLVRNLNQITMLWKPGSTSVHYTPMVYGDLYEVEFINSNPELYMCKWGYTTDHQC